MATADLEREPDERESGVEDLTEVRKVLIMRDALPPAHHVRGVSAAGRVVGCRRVDTERLNAVGGDPLGR